MSKGSVSPSPSASMAYARQVVGMKLHGSHRTVVDRVAVPAATVAVADVGELHAVQRGSEDPGPGGAVGVQDRTAVAAVVGLHAADAGEQRPLDATGRV